MFELVKNFLGKGSTTAEGNLSVKAIDKALEWHANLTYAIEMMESMQKKMGIDVVYNGETMCKVKTPIIESLGGSIEVILTEEGDLLSCKIVQE